MHRLLWVTPTVLSLWCLSCSGRHAADQPGADPAATGDTRRAGGELSADLDRDDGGPGDAAADSGGDRALADPRGDDAGGGDAHRVCTGEYPPYVGPPDQYSNVDTLRDAALIAALQQLTKANHQPLTYDGAKTALFGTSGIDVHGGEVECLYSGQLFTPAQLDRSGGFNTEHSWPQSEFAGETSAEKSDMHHIFPTEMVINSCRGNNDFGEIRSEEATCHAGGSARGQSSSSGSEVFRVRAQTRGDIARAHFYFATRYGLAIPNSEEAVLRCWHEDDPPDAVENARNDAIDALQHDRNPFVDRPELVGYISDF